jgi:hypothetical protein
MATTLQAYNRALDLIGQKGTLTSIAVVSPSCEALNRAFGLVLEEFIRTHRWSWATKRVALVATTAPAFGWTHAFTLPTDYVVAAELNGEDVWGKSGDSFVVESGVLLTDADAAELVYQAKPIATTTPSVTLAQAQEAMIGRMDPLAFRAFCTLLAAEVAPVIRNDGRELALNLMQQYQQVDLANAQNNDGSEARMERPDFRLDSLLLRARGGR